MVLEWLKPLQRRMGLVDDGLYGPNTQAAFDRYLPQPVKGEIVPNGKFTVELIEGAIEGERVHGVPASVSLAQWALESGWGKAMPPGSNNPFGMKARKHETGPVVTVPTREQRADGSWYTIHAPFRKFASMGEAFAEHAKLLGTAPVYAPARAKLPDLDAYVRTMGRIYATAHDYADIILSIINKYNLRQYDGRA